MLPSTENLRPGTILFGEYEIIGSLGAGGMGSVYRARHRSLASLRAIKVIRPDLVADPKAEELFIREAHALMEIRHDAVVRCHDLLRDENRIYLIMELVQGPSLEDILKDGALSAEEVLTLKRRIAAGLDAAHRGGVVHRDISPGNIILPNGDPSQAKLIDFGVAAVASVGGKTVVGDFKGKLAYASPEQFGLYGGKVDARSDIYSLGLVLAEAASGTQIPMGQTFYEALEIRKGMPRIPPQMPQNVRNEILPLLEPDPARRVRTAAELLEDRAEVTQPHPVRGEAAQDRGWLIPVLYSGTAVGVGIAIGLMVWMWKAGLVLPGTTAPAPQQQQPPAVTPAPTPKAGSGGGLRRADIIATAHRLATHSWTCWPGNTVARCVRGGYRSDFAPGQSITGVPYDWGGMDGPDELNAKLTRGYAAGSHARHGASDCTAGIDCSGLVAYCLGMRGAHSITTATMSSVADPLRGNVYADLKPGDALNKPGAHVVLFAGYRPDGGPIVYESNGSYARVVRNERSSWARFRNYRAMRFRNVVDP